MLALGGLSTLIFSAVTAGAGIAPAAQAQVAAQALPPSPPEMNMVTIQPGIGKLGSPAGEAKRDRSESPQQDVFIDYSFEVSKYEITFDDWNACLAGGGCRGYKPKDGGWGRGKRPVINISFEDAKSYIKWLNQKTGLKYRLLSEAEFEYLARGGTDSPFYTGSSISSEDANFNGKFTYNGSLPGDYLRKTAPVGSYAPNQFGLYDIIGNVFEWTEDCWHPSHKGAPNDGSARLDGDCTFRLMKGGSWVHHPYQVRAAKRTRYTTDYRYDDYGFRIARTLG